MSALRLAIIGDGKMGRAIADLARERAFVVTTMVGPADNVGGAALDRARLGDAEVVIEFTEPSAAPANILAAVRAGYPVVTGTTGWAAHLDDVASQVNAFGGALVHAPNFSVGVNLFLAIAAAAGRVMSRGPEFDAAIVETHHSAKKDAPSGTAIALERAVAERLGQRVPTSSVRTGHVLGVRRRDGNGAWPRELEQHALERREPRRIEVFDHLDDRCGVVSSQTRVTIHERAVDQLDALALPLGHPLEPKL